jgi:hypothetical protein
VRRLFWLSTVCLLAAALPARAATGHVVKVLPLLLDQKGRQALSPSLYDRDAYQAQLRLHPEQRSGLRVAIEWKAKGPVWEPLKLRVELRGVAEGNLPKQRVYETAAGTTSWFGRWTSITLDREDYRELGEVTAWRVTLWEGSQLLGEQKSFLW